MNQPPKEIDVRLNPMDGFEASEVIRMDFETAKNAAIINRNGRYFVYGFMSGDFKSLIYTEVQPPVEV